MQKISQFLNVQIAIRGNKKYSNYKEYSITTNSVKNNLILKSTIILNNIFNLLFKNIYLNNLKKI